MSPSLAALPPFAVIYVLALSTLLGMVLGSGLNCLAYRMARGQRWSGGRSVCPRCGHTLRLLDLIPVFSWLFLRGRCRYCSEPVSVRYPLSELCLGVCFFCVVFRFGLSLDALIALLLCGCLFSLSLVDLDVQLIPDRFLIIPAVARLLWLFFEGGFSGLLKGMVPALVLGGALLLLSLVMDKVLGRDSLGGGDIKLVGMLGLYFSLPCGLLMLLLSCVAGLIFAAVIVRAKKNLPFAFGPAISVGAFVTLLFGEQIVGWYLSLF